MTNQTTWDRLLTEARVAGLATGFAGGDEVIFLSEYGYPRIEFEVLTGRLEIIEELVSGLSVSQLPSGEGSTIIEVLAFVHLWKFTSARLARSEEEDPQPWAVWSDGGDIIGSGHTALEAIRGAEATVKEWSDAQA